MTTALAPFLLFTLAAPSVPCAQEDDPTVPDARVRAAAGQTRSAELPVPETTGALPACTLRALVVARGRPGVALIESGGVLHRAELGAVLRIEVGPSRVQELRVAGLTRDEVRLEGVANGQVLVLR